MKVKKKNTLKIIKIKINVKHLANRTNKVKIFTALIQDLLNFDWTK